VSRLIDHHSDHEHEEGEHAEEHDEHDVVPPIPSLRDFSPMQRALLGEVWCDVAQCCTLLGMYVCITIIDTIIPYIHTKNA
jgi:hypothetical protein